MFLGHVFLDDFLDYYHPEIPVETVSGFKKVSIDTDRICSFCIVTVFVDAFIRSLSFYLPNILLFITFDAEGQIQSISAFAPCSVPNFISFAPGLVGEVGRCDHVFAAFRISATAARCASAPGWSRLSYHFLFANFGLAQNIPQVPVSPEAKYRFLVEFRSFVWVDM